ncbi:MAG: hypothetical protein RJA70_4870, partial [Pseudomonadota bacterium]
MKLRQIFGAQPVREALRVHGPAVQQVWLLKDSTRLEGLARLAQDKGVEVQFVDRSTLDRLASRGMHQGAICEAPQLKLRSPKLALEDPEQLILALDGIQDPQNFGAVVRSAVGLGRARVVWGENSSAPLTPATFRASAGAVEHADLCRVPSLGQCLLDAQLKGYQVLGLDAHGDRSLRQCDLRGPTVLVIGSEGKGLGRGIRRHCTALVRLVAPHTIDSLNASVAAALALYEALAQRESAAGLPESRSVGAPSSGARGEALFEIPVPAAPPIAAQTEDVFEFAQPT